MYIVLLKFSDNKSDASKFMQAHNEWISKGVSDDVFQCIGSLDAGGGFILALEKDKKNLSARINEDPFVRHGVVSSEIYGVDVKITSEKMAYLK